MSAPHPGLVFTEIWGKVSGYPKMLQYVVSSLVRTFGYTAADGAKNQLWCAYDKSVKSGKYYEPVGKDVPG